MKKSFINVLLALCVSAVFSCGALAAEWPAKPVTLLCGYSAGGSSDLQCRYLASALEKELGVPVVVQNMPGGSGWISWNALAAAAPDGYTFALVNLGIVTGQYSKETPRDKKQDSFELLACHVVDPMALCMHTNEERFTDFMSFVKFGKENPVIMPSNGMAQLNPHATFFKLMKDHYGIDIAKVPVNGSKENETMFLSGDTDLFLAALGDCINGLKNKSYKLVAVFSDKEPSDFPDAPLIGNVSDVNLTMSTYRGYAFPLGVDKEIVAKMSAALEKVIKSEELIAKIHSMNADTYYMDGAEFKKRMVGEIDMRRKLEGLM